MINVLIFLPLVMHAAEDDFQLYLPTDRAEAFEGARSSVTLQSGPRLAFCFWFKSVNPKGGEILRLSDDAIMMQIAISENTFVIATANARNEITPTNTDLRDFRWHQTCLDCGSTGCQSYLDGAKLALIEPVKAVLTGKELNINIGFGAQFEGKVQKLEFATGEEGSKGLESQTVCGVQYKTVSDQLDSVQIRAEDLIVTRPIHTRDYESICNDMLSVDCGLDAISVSVSHTHLSTVGENAKFRWSRLSLMRQCANFTIKDYTTFTISPPDACGSEYVTTQHDRTIRNSVISYANDGQVFTADFQCQYPIDVTAVDYVEPVKSQEVKFRQKVVSVGLSRFETNDFKKLTDAAYEVEIGDLLHIAAVTPDEIDRDVRILVKSCQANGKEFLSDFGCLKSENSYVYSNGETGSARFSVKVPDWVVEFRCTVALCDWGDDCIVKCGKRGPRLRRDAEEEEENVIGTTEAPFIPIVTTAETIIEEIWTEQRSSLDSLSVTDVVYGPLNWLTVTRPETTMLPVLDTTVEDDDVIYTTDMPSIIFNESEDERTTQMPTDVVDDVVEEVVFVEDIVVVTEDDVVDNMTMPGWSTIVLVSISAFAFVCASVGLSLKWYRSTADRKLLTSSY